MPHDVPFVSIIIPCRNEAGWIRGCLESVLAMDYPPDRMEILVADGMSDDGTRAVIAEMARAQPRIRLVDNAKRITPAAMNVGLAHARGDVIVRMDAHSHYPADYVSSLVRWLESSGADNVGGVWVTRPVAETPIARAIAAGLSHPLGVGNAHFRIGTSTPRWVDTVPFGCYRREVFDRIGPFDEELIRNQDDELNLRLIKQGGKILLVPEIVSYYYPRASLAKLWRMYYQYGYFKPLVVRKVGGVMTARQLVPAAFLVTLGISGALAGLSPWAAGLFAALLASYLLAVTGVAAATAVRRRGWWGLALAVVFPVIHFSYGFGYLKGLLDFFLVRRSVPERASLIPLTR